MNQSRFSPLDPISRYAEILFGLLMVLTFTGGFNALEAGRAEVRDLLIAGIGCNIAWGMIDAIVYLITTLAERGHYPAIDIEQSASRVMHNVVSREHFELARRFRAVYSCYQKSKDLIQVGAYVNGSDPQVDEAIRLQPNMSKFLQQTMFEAAPMEQSVADMQAVLGTAA